MLPKFCIGLEPKIFAKMPLSFAHAYHNSSFMVVTPENIEEFI